MSITAFERANTTTSPTHRTDQRAIAVWLLSCAMMVLMMAVIGAITRLTGSGLSMVEWRPLIGTLPPLSETEWQRVFDLYRDSPEYRYVNAGMTLGEFKFIFFWEWFHRLWGRLIGIVFALPMAWFWVRGHFSGSLKWKTSGLLLLGGLQGVMGWLMVMSGLVDEPTVSHYRLAVHLGLAFIIFAWLLHVALEVLNQQEPRAQRTHPLHHHVIGSLVLVAVTIVWGAMVAGTRAGLSYNTFPLMGGTLLPGEAWALSPLWINPVENIAMIQFLHRWLALATAGVILALWWRARAMPLPVPATMATAFTAGAVILQVGLGIATLLLEVPIEIATLHQAGAFVLVATLVWLRFELTRERALKGLKRP